MTELQELERIVAMEVNEISDADIDKLVAILRAQRQEFKLTGPAGVKGRKKAAPGSEDNLTYADLDIQL